MTVLFEAALFADYHQIVVADTAAPDDSFPQDFPDEVIMWRVNLSPGVIVVQTARNMTVPFRVELHEAEPSVDLAAVDHAVECSIVTSGEISIAGLMDFPPEAAPAKVPAGPLRALVVSTGLGTLSENGLDGDDAYVMHLWPAPEGPIVVRKQWVDG